MPKPRNTNAPTRLDLAIPEDLRARLDLLLYSELEGRVPHGAYARFFCSRLREHFEWTRLDLEAFGFPPGYFITGPREMVDKLKSTLENA